MQFTSETVDDGLIERRFSIGDVPGILWTPAGDHDPRPFILLGHGGGQHKAAAVAEQDERARVVVAGRRPQDARHIADGETTFDESVVDGL